MATQPLTGIVKVSVSTATPAPSAQQLDVGLIIGTSTIISPATRTASYANTAAMKTAGWVATDPEYLAAVEYFAQTPTPPSVVVGVQNTATTPVDTTLSTALVADTQYTAIDVPALGAAVASGTPILLNNGSGTTQLIYASGVTASGATAITVQQFTANAAYAISDAVVIDPSETPLMALQACQAAAGGTFYGVYVCGIADADTEAVANYLLAGNGMLAQFYETSESAVSGGQPGNVMATLQTALAGRTFGLFSSTLYAGAAAMGEAMGLAAAGQAFTLAYKTLQQVTPENLNSGAVASITGYGGNVFTNYGNAYNLLVQGTMHDGTPFDQLYNQDSLTAQFNSAIMNLLTTTTSKIPLTDSGVALVVNALDAVCAAAAKSGVLDPGAVWNGGTVLNLTDGTTLPDGYAILAASVSTLTSAQRAARQAPAMYACLAFAGAIEHVVIPIFVQL